MSLSILLFLLTRTVPQILWWLKPRKKNWMDNPRSTGYWTSSPRKKFFNESGCLLVATLWSSGGVRDDWGCIGKMRGTWCPSRDGRCLRTIGCPEWSSSQRDPHIRYHNRRTHCAGTMDRGNWMFAHRYGKYLIGSPYGTSSKRLTLRCCWRTLITSRIFLVERQTWKMLNGLQSSSAQG